MNLTCCAICGKPFGVGVIHSREHILPNSIGGNKSVYGVVCKDCNDRAGSEWDSVLAKQLEFVSHVVKVRRDRGQSPTITVKTASGEPIRIHADGRLSDPRTPPAITAEGAGIKISGRVATRGDARKLFMGLKRKYPKFDVEGALSRLKVEKRYLTEPVGGSVYIDGDDSGRSIVKSAFVLAVHSGVMPERCERAKEYFKGQVDNPCWWFYYDRDFIASRPKGRIFHCVAVKGNSKTRQLVGYVELFRTYRMLVLLSSEYDGDNFTTSYTVDPTTGRELKLDLDLDLPAEEVILACRGERDYGDAILAAINGMMAIAYPEKRKRDRNRAVEEAVLSARQKLNLGPGATITRQQAAEFSRLVAKDLTEFLIHQSAARRLPKK
jgi:hypothetical protein